MTFDLQGHRGARGLAPENTLPAFARALEIGVTTLELDAAITRDGVLVAHHDRRLNPALARGPGAGRRGWIGAPGPLIRDLTFAELSRYDVGRIDPASAYARRFPHQAALDGTRIPSLAELFALVRERGDEGVRFNIETKIDPRHPEETVGPEKFTVALVAAIRAAGLASRATIQSFDWRTLRIVQATAAEIQTVYLSSEQPPDQTLRGPPGAASPWTAGLRREDFPSTPAMVSAAGGRLWSPDHRDVDEAAASAAAALGVAFVPWTVNEPQDLARMLALGAAGVITDYPDRTAAALAARGIAFRTPAGSPRARP